MLFRKFKTLIQLPLEVKILFIKAIFISAYVKLIRTFLPFKKIKPYLGTPNKESDKHCSEEDVIYIRRVQTALRLCNKYTPWKTECYTLALTGKILLSHKNILSTLYFGFRKNNTDVFEGHAWLRSGPVIITGKQNILSYSVQSYFT